MEKQQQIHRQANKVITRCEMRVKETKASQREMQEFLLASPVPNVVSDT